jgi:hypothetical protein
MIEINPDTAEAEALDIAQWLTLYAQTTPLPFTSLRVRQAAVMLEWYVKERSRLLVDNPGFGG